MMARFRKIETGPELALRALLTEAGVPFEAYPALLGSPDLVLLDKEVAVFVHGCFWHGCRLHYRAPRSRPSYWKRKLDRNVKRDRSVSRRLRKAGWHVATVWECKIKRDPMAVIKRLLRIAEQSNGRLSHSQ